MTEQIVYPRDNSYLHAIDNYNELEVPQLAGSIYNNAKPVKLLSKPYKLQIKNIFGDYQIYEFVTVEYEGKLYRILNYYTTTPDVDRDTY